MQRVGLCTFSVFYMAVDERACDQHYSKNSARDPRVSEMLLASDVLHGTLNKKPVDLQGMYSTKITGY